MAIDPTTPMTLQPVVPPVPPGVYQVRVLGFSAANAPIGLASDALTLTVR